MNRQTTYATGDIIIEEASFGDCAFLIDYGIVEVYVLRGEKKIVLGILSDGDIFGEMALISGEPRSASVRTLAPTRISLICKPFFEQKLAQSDPVIALLMKVVLQRFHEARDRLLAMPPMCWDAITPPDAQANPVGDQWRDTLQRLNFITDLQQAVQQGQMRLLYQPVISLADGTLAGFEALARWQHPTLGMVMPSTFIQIAEDTHDIIPIGYWALETACMALKALRAVGGENLWMSVNVSPAQLRDRKLARQFAAILQRTAAPPDKIKLELTESVLADDPETVLLFLRNAKRLGVSIAIDDFGTGYSSLSYLHCFPIDVLKIDQSFIATMLRDTRSREIVQAVVTLSKNLELDIVAEGVETAEAESLLRVLGCRYGQGYLYAKPVGLEEAIGMVGRVFRVDK
ncbi:MAG: EAL domain-containing protein [Candidatus Methylumidiphilus sp.]